MYVRTVINHKLCKDLQAQSMLRCTAWSSPNTSPSSAPCSRLVTSGISPDPPAPLTPTPSAPCWGGGGKGWRGIKRIVQGECGGNV